MRRFGLAILVLGAALAFGSVQEGTSATLLWKNYKSPDSDTMRLLNERHLDGIIDGLVSYNIFLHKDNDELLFCLPDNSVLTVREAEEIIGNVAKRLANPDDVPVSLLLIIGLKEQFACP
jgi:hypothetical protein